MQQIYLITVAMLLAFGLTGCTSEKAGIVLSDSSEVEITLEEYSEEDKAQNTQESVSSSGSSAAEPADITAPDLTGSVYVYVCGAVAEPGVYELEEGSRITDAVEAAGGFAGEADRDYVNLAAPLTDGMKLKIPTIAETEPDKDIAGIESFDETASKEPGDKLVNINSASVEELKTLPGIGEATAGRIIDYRKEHGSFKTKEDIMNVSGIKEKLFSRISDNITV